MSIEAIIDESVEDFIKDYYQEKYTEYEPERAFFKEPKFLIVEDDLAYKPLWDFILRKVDQKFSFDWVTSVNEAELLIKKSLQSGRPYDLIIADIFLDGNETGIDLWRKHGITYNNMVLVSSIEYERLIRDLRQETYVPPYLKKPLNVQESVKTINKSLLMSYF